MHTTTLKCASACTHLCPDGVFRHVGGIVERNDGEVGEGGGEEGDEEFTEVDHVHRCACRENVTRGRECDTWTFSAPVRLPRRTADLCATWLAAP